MIHIKYDNSFKEAILKEKNISSNFDDFLKGDGIFEEVQETAIKRVFT